MDDVLQDEIDMVLSMYSDECQRDASEPHALFVSLPFRFALHIVLPSSYPEVGHPVVSVINGPNAPLRSAFSSEINKRIREEIPLGVPMLMMLMPLAQSVAEELQSAKATEAAEQRARAEALQVEMAKENQRLDEAAIEVWSGAPIVDRKSKFVCHMARVKSVSEVFSVVAHLRRNNQIAAAAHPTIWAYRFTVNGILHQDFDDDGEAGASVKMMFLLDQMKIDGFVIVVTRWFGGILLGPDRFKHIMEVSRKMLLTVEEREKGSSGLPPAKHGKPRGPSG